MKGPLEADFKDSITRKRWLGCSAKVGRYVYRGRMGTRLEVFICRDKGPEASGEKQKSGK